VTDVAKQKPAAKKKPATKAAKPKKVAKPASKPAPKAVPLADASAALREMGFFRGGYNWEADRDVPALGGRVRLLVDHTGDVVAPEQVRALELLLEEEKPLLPLAHRAAYETMLGWVEGFRKRHPGFKGKPLSEKAFNRGCDLGTVVFPSPKPSEAEAKSPPTFVLNLFWPEDDRPCAIRFERHRGGWTVVSSERS
jgi:hypothetical protein